jgi:4-amino-4-deoxy-L-arabinose transferase-like glycosyltransferase
VNASRPLAEPLRYSDLLWIAGALLVLVFAGYGLRDPWPADEPRFASLAHDMVTSGQWLFPRVGGDLYQDKPPLYFWLLALAYTLIGSVRWSFLLPSFLAACGTLYLTCDLARRLAGRRAALAATLTLAATVQFVSTMRSAQIDATLCFLTTLSLYGFLRHLLIAESWRWYFVAGFAAGLGVITKGVGFLPILLLLPYVLMRRAGWQGLAPMHTAGWRWAIAPIALLLAIALWFVPMWVVVAHSGSGDYVAYRDEILFKQTVQRYSAAWHHVQPWYFYLLEVIPALWLPFSVLLIWLVPRWRTAWHQRDARVWLPLAWLMTALVFFSLSPGKRGIYLNPALPGLAIAAAPFLVEIHAKAWVQRLGMALAILPLLAALVFALSFANDATYALEAVAAAGLRGPWPVYVFLLLGSAGALTAWKIHRAAPWLAVLGALALTWGYGIAPAMNPERSASAFVGSVMRSLPKEQSLALVAYKEQFLLYLDRPTVNFGHRRWQEGPQETHDAAAWLAAGPDRVLLLSGTAISPCFAGNASVSVGDSGGEAWYLVRGQPDDRCVAMGNANRAIATPFSPHSAGGLLE